jgi:hypothetical protein
VLREKAKQVRHKGIEVLNKRTKSFRDALAERDSALKTQDTVEKEIIKIRRNVGKRVNTFLEKWDDAKAVSTREKIRWRYRLCLSLSLCFADCFSFAQFLYQRDEHPVYVFDAGLQARVDVCSFSLISSFLSLTPDTGAS